MRIGIDCRFASANAGLGRYTREVVTNLLQLDSNFTYVLFVRDQKESWITSLPKTFNFQLSTFDYGHYTLAEQIRFPKIIRSSGIDLFFSPHFNVPFLCPVPFIVTIHDLILHRFPNHRTPFAQAVYRFFMRHALQKSAAIICVSAFTADDVATVYGEALRKKITVIHEGVSPEFHPASEKEKETVKKKYGLTKPFYIYVGNAKQHKNVPVLLESFSKLQTSEKELVLVTGGKEAASLSLPSGVRILSDVPEEDLPVLYSSALCFVSASLYEGFGLPLIEAAACGCPAIVSNRGAFPEIAQPGTVLIEPDTECFTQALASPPLPFPPSAPRSWVDTASNTLAVLRELTEPV
jgi:glycosyltransferase involved in cell wall biosynthesis